MHMGVGAGAPFQKWEGAKLSCSPSFFFVFFGKLLLETAGI
jgi:hypothetical protein